MQKTAHSRIERSVKKETNTNHNNNYRVTCRYAGIESEMRFKF